MATQRSTFPARLQQILSSGRAAIPSLKLESEPPPNIKAFIDRVIKSPLHDIAIPLSGFRWEYHKGNFHHWRPLFLHFDTYFKTYLSSRKDLLLSDNIVEEDIFPKHTILLILRVMQTILENCHNKSSFSGLEHFKLLLSSTDPDILLAALETLSALVKINPSKLHGSGKPIGCGLMNSYLLSLAQGWGSKEEGLGLYSCIMTNERRQHDGLCLFPQEMEDKTDGNQYRLGSTLHFEFHMPQEDEQSSYKGLVSNIRVIHFPDLHLQKEDDLTLLKQLVDQHNVPQEHRFSLLTRIRYAHAFRSPRVIRLYSRICILAFIVLVQLSDAHDELVSFFANEPEYTNELIRLVRSEDSVPGVIKVLAMQALGAQLAAYTSSHERARILSGSSIISVGGNRMLLLTVLQKAISSLSNSSDPSSVLFVEALLQFFLLHVLSSSSSGNAIRGTGIVPPLLPLLQDTDSSHMHLVCTAVKTLQKLMEYSNPAVSLFKDLGGVELLTQRLHIEVHRVIGRDVGPSSVAIISDVSNLTEDHAYSQKRLMKILLKALGCATYSPANTARSQSFQNGSLPRTLALIFHNVGKFGGDIYFSAVTLMSEIIHKDPTCFPILLEFDLPDAFLSSVTHGLLPSSKALICIPGALGAICLNAKGLEAVRETACMQFLVDIFTTKKYLVAMNEGVVLLASAVEELLRHVSSLRNTGVDIIIDIINKLASMGDDKIFGPNERMDGESAMEIDNEEKENRGQNLVDTMEANTEGVSNEQFLQLCVFHAMILVNRVMENSETCRLFVEKKGIEALMRLLLQPCIAQSSEGMPIALHSTVVFKGFTQHHSGPLAVAWCSALREYSNRALNKFNAISGTFLLNPKAAIDREIFYPLFVIEFLLLLAACKDHRWITALLTEFGNGSRDVLENIGQVHREIMWQNALLEESKLETEGEKSSSTEINTLDTNFGDNDDLRLSSIRQYIDPLLRRRASGWSIESQFLDLISMYRDIGRATGSPQGSTLDTSVDSQLTSSSQAQAPSSSPGSSTTIASTKVGDKQKSFYASCREMMRSLSYHISHLFLELGKAMLLSSRRGGDPVIMTPSARSVVSTFASIGLDHLNFTGYASYVSETEISVPTKCRYLGKVVDFIDGILLEKTESCNPIVINCFYGQGVIHAILTTFEATSQLLFTINRSPASPMETDDESSKHDLREDMSNNWIYGPLTSYGTLMDHLVTSSLIISSSTRQLLEHPLINGDIPFPRDAEAYVKMLQCKVLKVVLPIWNHPRFPDCNYEFTASVMSIMKHIYSGIEVRNVNNGNAGHRITGPPPDESTISLITDMGFSRSRAEEALRQVGRNSVELATDWLFSNPEEAQEDDELARALKMSLGNSASTLNEDVSDPGTSDVEIETPQLPPIDELLAACVRLLQAKESFAFPVRDLLVTISTQNDGEQRLKVLRPLMDQLRCCHDISNSSNTVILSALFHVLALILHEDVAAREVSVKSGLASISLDILSQWDPTSYNAEKPDVPKWLTASFLSIDQMLQLESKLSPEGIALEKNKTETVHQQTSVVINEEKLDDSQSSGPPSTSPLDTHDKKRLIEIACKCIKSQLPSDTMHVVLQLCATLTKTHAVAINFLDAGGLPALLSLPTSSLFSGFDNIAAAIIRHILEDPQTLQQAMEAEIRHSLVSLSNRHSTGRVTPRSFVQNLSSIISRDPVIFMRAAESVCQIEMTGERPYVTLLKDRDKEKGKEKDKASENEKQHASDVKAAAGDAGPLVPGSGQNRVTDSSIKSLKFHRKSPPTFTSVIELLLDSIMMFVPPAKVDGPIDVVHGTSLSGMDIDSALGKGKGKAVAVPVETGKVASQEASASLAKTVFILKLLTEILLTYASSIHILLRRDTEISCFRGPPHGSSANHSGVFHHVLHKFLPYGGIQKKDKKADTDWRQKLATRANQFLVASSVRSAEGRKRILSDVNNTLVEFVESSDGCKVPDINMHAFVDLLNDILAARSSTGSYVSAEAAVAFIDVGLVRTLTRTLQVLDLDHVDSQKAVTGIVKALELVSKEHAHSSDSSSAKGDLSLKIGSDQSEHERNSDMNNSRNRFHSLETTSLPDHNGAVTNHAEPFNATQTSGSSESATDDMDHDRDTDGGFAPEGEDYFMHETSEVGGITGNGIANVEISFDIPRNVEDNLGDEDDEDMSADEGEGDDDDDDEDEDNNHLGEDEIHRMSHHETDQDEHDIDEEFDEDILDEDDEEEDDDDDGVILRLEEGINGINAFDQIELFGPGGSNFSNETLRVMPLEVFSSRRQGRSASIYNLLGRSGDHRVSSEHPLLSDPSSLRHLVRHRQSENTVDAAFSDRNLDNSSSRLDTVFRSFRTARHGHHLNMWVDDTRQRGGSNATAIPQGIEEILVSRLRQPASEQTSEQAVPDVCPQNKDESNQLDGAAVGSRTERPSDGIMNDESMAVAPPGSVASTDSADARLDHGAEYPESEISNTREQVIGMQYERNEATVRDMEAVSLESGGSSTTIGESLRSLEVEIGSADGHDDTERQGELHQMTRQRRPSGATMPLGARDSSLESVIEAPSVPPQVSDQTAVLEEPNRNADTGSIDPTFLDALPEELRAEVLSAQQNQLAQPSTGQPQGTADIDPEFLAALPPDIRAEVLAQQQAQRLHQSQELEGQPVEMDTVSIIATFPSDIREEVLLTSPDTVLANLTPALVEEANMLRERFARQYHSGALFGVYPRNRRGESSRRGEAIGSGLGRAIVSSSRRSLGTKLVEADGSPLVDTEALKAMIRLLRVVQPLYKGQLQRLLLNLCAHHDTRISLVRILMHTVMLDVRGAGSCASDAVESSYRLYGCQSHVMYSRPQFSNGVPPLVSRRILETLTHLARNHPNVAKLLLHLELPRPPLYTVDQGRGKSIVAMEEDDHQVKNGDASIVLLLSLLNQPIYLRSVAHLEQLLNLLDVVIGNAESDTGLEKKSGGHSDSTAPDVQSDVVPAESADDEGKHLPIIPHPSSSLSTSHIDDTHAVLLSLPQSDLRQLCTLLARDGLSDSAYQLVSDVLKKLVSIVPNHCHLFITELANSIQTLTKSAIIELRLYEETERALMSSSSADGTAILRVLQALSSLVTSLHEKGSDNQGHHEKDHSGTLSQISSINTTLEPLWSELSNCISKIESYSESLSDLGSSPNSVFLGANVVPPLPVGTQNILPYIESFFVTCEKLHAGQSSVQDISSAMASDIEDTALTGSGSRQLANSSKNDEKNVVFLKFSEKHRKLLNAFIRQNPGLLEKSFSLMLKVPRFIEFDNKRAHFRSKIKHQHDHHHSSLRISVRRAYILEDSYNQLRMRSPQDLKGRLTVHFQGEEGIDAGGLTREWYQLLSRVIFDKGALLFTTVGNESTFQPNPNSVYQTEHLSYFKFVGRVVGKALFDGQLLDVHFTRSFYKHILGVKVTYHDIEAIDPDYYKNLKWMLENDISDVLGLTFSIDADEEKLILYERTEVTDHELIPGGRNIRVTEENKHEYVDLVAEHRLTTAIRPQINAFLEGFIDLIPKDLISIFNDKELELLINGLPDIDLDDLRVNTEYSGYSNASPVVQWFWEIVQGFNKEDKARLLQFVTGTSKVPLEGFSALQGISGSQRFQIHKAYGSPDHLPSAHTCFNQLDLPEYPSKEQLQERLLLAIHEANEGFGFG